MAKSPCLAIVLINPREPQYAASYHWCKLEEHAPDELHVCYCGIWWMAESEDIVPPTKEMIEWRTGSQSVVKRVSGRMMG